MDTSRGGSRAFQISVKVDHLKASMVDVASNKKVSDVVRRSVGCGRQDVYATCEARMLRKDDELKSCGVRDGSTVQIVKRTRGGGKLKDKKGQKERKQAASTKRREQKYAEGAKSDKGRAIQECDRDPVIRMLKENEG